jgi:hypothetical protein
MQLQRENNELKEKNNCFKAEIENVQYLHEPEVNEPYVNDVQGDSNKSCVHNCQSTSPGEETPKQIVKEDLFKEILTAVHPVAEIKPQQSTAAGVSNVSSMKIPWNNDD